MALRNLVFREEPGIFVGSCKCWALARSPLKQMLAGREGPQCQMACALQVVLGCRGERAAHGSSEHLVKSTGRHLKVSL